MPREHITPSCENDPLWYDCSRNQCADCPWRICPGGCGEIQQDCACADLDDEQPGSRCGPACGYCGRCS